jgi:hypothetical protein
MRQSWPVILLLTGIVAACDGPAPTELPPPAAFSPSLEREGHDNDALTSTVGAGVYRLQNAFDVKFTFAAGVTKHGRAHGAFRQHLAADGLVIDFTAKVTCLVFDAEHHRAWIGGVITKNRSTDPAFVGEIFEPGHDVWFRVVDYGEGSTATQPDRTTFLGFENNPTIKTSEQYCREKPWPDDDARTWPVTKGKLRVR